MSKYSHIGTFLLGGIVFSMFQAAIAENSESKFIRVDSAHAAEDSTPRVTGIGGIFFRSNNEINTSSI